MCNRCDSSTKWRFFFSFLRSFEQRFRNKRVIRFLRRPRQGHSWFLEIVKKKKTKTKKNLMSAPIQLQIWFRSIFLKREVCGENVEKTWRNKLLMFAHYTRTSQTGSTSMRCYTDILYVVLLLFHKNTSWKKTGFFYMVNEKKLTNPWALVDYKVPDSSFAAPTASNWSFLFCLRPMAASWFKTTKAKEAETTRKHSFCFIIYKCLLNTI